MKTLLIAAALAALVSPVFAQEDVSFSEFYKSQIGTPADITILEDCQFTVGLRDSAGDMAEGSICGKAVGYWLYDTGRASDADSDEEHFSKLLCAAWLIVTDATPTKTSEEILAPSYDAACGEPPATM